MIPDGHDVIGDITLDTIKELIKPILYIVAQITGTIKTIQSGLQFSISSKTHSKLGLLYYTLKDFIGLKCQTDLSATNQLIRGLWHFCRNNLGKGAIPLIDI